MECVFGKRHTVAPMWYSAAVIGTVASRALVRVEGSKNDRT